MVGRARRLVLVGAGPRAVMLLERVLARLDADAALDIRLVDPHPPGPGRIWRRAQSPLLKLNSMARDITVFTDESCTIDGPIRPGPSLIEWAAAWRAGDLADVEIADPAAAAEARELLGESFPTRRLQSFYLDWFYRRTVAGAPPGVSVRWHADVVTGVAAAPGGGHVVALAGGARVHSDVVVYCVGHNGRTPDDEVAALIGASAAAGLRYVPPDFTADADLSGIGAGEDVVVRGMGLAAVDLVVLLTHGRGGRFRRDDGGRLHYAASGDEPRLHLGSRRGVPYRSKVSSTLLGEPPRREALTPEAIAALVGRPGSIDFERDVWPLLTTELLLGHYRELFTGHPERTRGSWPAFRDALIRRGGDPAGLRALVEPAVPDPLDRLDIATLDRPFAGARFADADDVHRRVRAHVARDLVLRTTPERSAAQGLFLAALQCTLALSEIPAERWSARSRAEGLPHRWHGFFSYIASGPPPHRLEELLALADAGVVRFLGPDLHVRVEPGRGFVASSPRVPGEVVAPILVDARLPQTAGATSVNEALRELATAHGTELHVVDDDFAGTLGRVHTDAGGRIVRRDGSAHDGLFGIGPFTSSAEGGAFSRPGIDALAFRQTDRVAAAVLARLDQDAGASSFAKHFENVKSR